MITTTTADNLRIVTLDRPERRNALTPEGLESLFETMTDATEPVCYLTGAGTAFCAGADLETVENATPEQAETIATRGQQVANAIEGYDGVVVAGIDGPARGGGVELALACDLRIGTPEATVAESGVALGLFGAWGGTARLPRIVGEGVAMDISVSGRVLDAEEAKQVGLLSRITENPRAVAESIAENDPAALRAIKRRIRDDSPRSEQERREVEAFRELAAGRHGRK